MFNAFVLLLSLLGLAEFYRMALPERKGAGLAASLFGALLPVNLEHLLPGGRQEQVEGRPVRDLGEEEGGGAVGGADALLRFDPPFGPVGPPSEPLEGG